MTTPPKQELLPVEIPHPVLDAATLISNFFKVNGIKDWKLMDIQSRTPPPSIDDKEVERLATDICCYQFDGGMYASYEGVVEVVNKATQHLASEVEHLRKELSVVQSQRDADYLNLKSKLNVAEKHNWNNHVCVHHNDLERAKAIGKCPACLQQRLSKAEKDSENMRSQVVLHLGNMLDEVHTTHRVDWPRHLYCNECNVQSPNHNSSCKIGHAYKFWDEITAAIQSNKPKEGK